MSASIPGVLNLSVTPDTRVLLNPSDPRVLALKEFEDTFTAQNIVAFIVACEDSEQSCRSDLPDLVRKLTNQARELPFAVKVDSLYTTPLISSDEQSISISNYLDAFCTPACPDKIYENVDEPERITRFVNSDASVFGVYVSLNFDSSSLYSVERIYTSAQSIISGYKSSDAISVRFVGRVPMMQAFVDATNNELTGLMGAALIIIFCLVWLTYGNLRLTLLQVSLSVLTILSTLGLAGWFGLVLNTATAALPSIILTLTTATSMHYFMHVIRVMSEDSLRDQKKVAYGAVTYQLTPTLMTAGTTIVAMGSMISVDSPPFRDIGIWTAVSLVYACIYLFILVPPIIGRLPKLNPSFWQRRIQPLLNKQARFVQQGQRSAIVALFLSLGFGSAIFQLEIDDDFVRYFGPKTSFRMDTEFVSQNLVGPTNLEIVVDSHVPGGIYRDQYLESIQEIVTTLRSDHRVDSVLSIIDILAPISTHFAQINWQDASETLIAQLLLSYELSLEKGQSTNDFVDPQHQKSRISIIAQDLTSHQISQLEDYIQRIVDDAKYKSLEVEITGEALPLAYLSDRNIPNIVISLVFILFLVSTLLGLYFRSLRAGFLLFTTTIVPVVLGFGIWSLFSPSVGLAATVILSVCMGVVIDDSIHMIYRFHDGIRRLNLAQGEAASYAVHRVGSAITTTTLVLVLGFGVLSFSSFEINRTFGICTVLILLSALLIDLLILPSLLPSRGQPKQELTNYTNEGRQQSSRDEL